LFKERIEKGTPFYPVSAFRTKLFMYIVTGFILITLGIYGLGGFIGFIANFDDDPSDSEFGRFIVSNFTTITVVYFSIGLLSMLILAILADNYYRTMEFQILDNEVIVRKGVINKEVKHIPLRNITNVSSRYGIYDRFLGIGTVEIETAGKSGQATGPEAKEVEPSVPVKVSITEQEFQKEMLSEIREIKELLSK
jgi:uncharacterized membrane protein YdbT with pleckstrin-like domain